MAAIAENLTAAGLTVAALALSLVAFRAWWSTRSRKVLLLMIGFLLFFVKGLTVSVLLFTDSQWEQKTLLPSLLLDLAILGVFYAAVFTRSRS